MFPDQTELVEERDENSNELLVRKWKRPKEFGEAQWEYEVGDDGKVFNPENDLLSASSNNPIFMRKDTADRFEWRIRNLPYPKETYNIEVDSQKQQIVLKTTNKKYYKRIDIPDLKRVGLQIDDSQVMWKYANNTVIIAYQKPAKVKARDQEMIKLANQAAQTGFGASSAYSAAGS